MKISQTFILSGSVSDSSSASNQITAASTMSTPTNAITPATTKPDVLEKVAENVLFPNTFSPNLAFDEQNADSGIATADGTTKRIEGTTGGVTTSRSFTNTPTATTGVEEVVVGSDARYSATSKSAFIEKATQTSASFFLVFILRLLLSINPCSMRVTILLCTTCVTASLPRDSLDPELAFYSISDDTITFAQLGNEGTTLQSSIAANIHFTSLATDNPLSNIALENAGVDNGPRYSNSTEQAFFQKLIDNEPYNSLDPNMAFNSMSDGQNKFLTLGDETHKIQTNNAAEESPTSLTTNASSLAPTSLEPALPSSNAPSSEPFVTTLTSKVTTESLTTTTPILTTLLPSGAQTTQRTSTLSVKESTSVISNTLSGATVSLSGNNPWPKFTTNTLKINNPETDELEPDLAYNVISDDQNQNIGLRNEDAIKRTKAAATQTMGTSKGMSLEEEIITNKDRPPHIHIQKNRHSHIQTDPKRHSNRHPDRQKDRQTSKHLDIHTDRLI